MAQLAIITKSGGIYARTFGVAHILTESQPDSRQQVKDSQEFNAVEDSRQLRP